MNKKDIQDLEYIKNVLISHLGNIVETPKGKMILAELYSNGNVGCIPVDCTQYFRQLSEFHSLSVKPIDSK